GEMHLLWVLPGGLPGRRDCGRAQFRVLHRDPRGALLRQGAAACERRSLGAGDRQEPSARCTLQVRLLWAILPIYPLSCPALCRASTFCRLAAAKIVVGRERP